MTNRKKLTTERKKDPAYISTGFTSWKKAPECFKEHKQRKCHTATLIYETYAPKMCNLVEMHITEIAKKTAQECQCLKIRLQYLQCLKRSGLSIGENDDGNDNFTQLLLLCGKDQPFATERVTSSVPGIKKYNNSFSG